VKDFTIVVLKKAVLKDIFVIETTLIQQRVQNPRKVQNGRIVTIIRGTGFWGTIALIVPVICGGPDFGAQLRPDCSPNLL